jgi:hypothetical protein
MDKKKEPSIFDMPQSSNYNSNVNDPANIAFDNLITWPLLVGGTLASLTFYYIDTSWLPHLMSTKIENNIFWFIAIGVLEFFICLGVWIFVKKKFFTKKQNVIRGGQTSELSKAKRDLGKME